MGHEAAHHIRAHLDRQQRNATAGALIFGGLAAITGAGEQAVESAQQVGATVGARGYSKDFELEADELGTIIAHRAGYDPVLGAAFFTKIADPGNRFLGTHPPNAARIDIFAKATHNTWALLCSETGPIKNDDGESGAGAIILRMLERAELADHLIIVTRWYGGTHLGGDRFRRVQDCVNAYLEQAPDLPSQPLQKD